ncbi:MAG: hypothetical protein V1820_06360 [archaeon]
MDKPWLERKFRDGARFTFPVSYIVEHLKMERQKEVIFTDNDVWQVSKERRIRELLDAGKKPYPIDLSLEPNAELFVVGDGVTRLRVYRERGIEFVEAKLYHG